MQSQSYLHDVVDLGISHIDPVGVVVQGDSVRPIDTFRYYFNEIGPIHPSSCYKRL